MEDPQMGGRHVHHRPVERQRPRDPVGLMARLARIRKAIVAAVGMAITLVLLVPAEQIPEQWRPWVGLLLALGTVLGVYRVYNQPVKTVAPTLFAGRPAKEPPRPQE